MSEGVFPKYIGKQEANSVRKNLPSLWLAPANTLPHETVAEDPFMGFLDSSILNVFNPSIYLVWGEGEGLACTIHSVSVEIREQLADIRPWASNSSQALRILPSEPSLQPCLASFELFNFP